MSRSHERGEFPPAPLRQYALIADGERGALCGPHGELVWLCVPRWHDDAVFATLIGGSGAYAVTPAERALWGGHYEPNTLIWHNRWVTDTGAIVECHDALLMPARPDRLVVLRRVEVLRGTTEAHVLLDVCDRFGADDMSDLHRDGQGTWTGRAHRVRFRWSGAQDARVDRDGRLVSRMRMDAGAHHDLVLELATGELDHDRPDAERAWKSTRAAWSADVPDFAYTAAPRDTGHAYAVLRGLTSGTGATVAAVTTSLPERAATSTNYDYRYVWVRDQCFAGVAAGADGPHPLLHGSVAFVRERLLDHGERLRAAYLVDGGDVPDEESLELPGYPGGTDIRGNRAHSQFQLDTFGEALQLFACAARHDALDRDAHRAAEVAVTAIESRWLDPDSGIWELDAAWWTHSRLACVAGLRAYADAAAATRAARGSSEPDRLHALADAILAETGRRCVTPGGRWQRTPTDARVDAALVLPPVRGAVPAADSRTLATLQAVRRELVDDGYVYRYAPQDEPLGSQEGAFLLCGFVMALAELHQGNVVEAFRYFERNRAACGPPGLLAEEFDVVERQLRGNLPQAFVHALLLETSIRLAEYTVPS